MSTLPCTDPAGSTRGAASVPPRSTRSTRSRGPSPLHACAIHILSWSDSPLAANESQKTAQGPRKNPKKSNSQCNSLDFGEKIEVHVLQLSGAFPTIPAFHMPGNPGILQHGVAGHRIQSPLPGAQPLLADQTVPLNEEVGSRVSILTLMDLLLSSKGRR